MPQTSHGFLGLQAADRGDFRCPGMTPCAWLPTCCSCRAGCNAMFGPGVRLQETDRYRAPAMTTSGLHVITSEERAEFAAFVRDNARLSSALPLTLPCRFVVHVFHPECAMCKQEIPTTWAWLSRNRITFGQKVVETWDVRGICPACRTMTSCYIRFRSDGTFDTLIGSHWRNGTLNGSGRAFGMLLRPCTTRPCRRFRRWVG
jgi:hypothetical protein